MELEKICLKLENASFEISHGKIPRKTETHLVSHSVRSSTEVLTWLITLVGVGGGGDGGGGGGGV